MKFLLLFTCLLFSLVSFKAQNPIGFDANCKKYISGTIPLAHPKQLYGAMENSKTKILDAREKREYQISHIPTAIHVGFDNFNKKSVGSISKTDTVFIYCSIGYRSEKIGEKLQKLGFKNVFNLYGGIFGWVNSGYKVFDKNQNQTINVHGYNEEWSKMLNGNRCSIKLK